MVFAFTPDPPRPARIFRYVERGALPDNSLLSIYILEQNLLIIDREYFSLLSEQEKRAVLRTHHPYHEVSEFEAFRRKAA